MSYLFQFANADWEPATAAQQKEARELISRRLEAGEDIYSILEQTTEHAYYVDKLMRGLIPIGKFLYYTVVIQYYEKLAQEREAQAEPAPTDGQLSA